ncbi:MAG TPA: NAD(+) diphosphatase [Paraburkholderia sp.]|jgi:NAD+ diphosphatase|nr:NAD(+) diphosphatase [Paraburkholderia sp.]
MTETPAPTAIGFNFNPLDRRSEKRDDDAFIAGLRDAATARFLVFDADAPLLKRNGERLDPWFSAGEAAAFGAPLQSIFLGETADGSGCFGLGFTRNESIDEVRYARIDVRSIAMQGLFEAEVPGTLGMLGEAKSMLDWHRRHGFCANCGTVSRSTAAGWQRVCDNCGTRHFPRVDPVVIMLVIDGERCLLGRQPQFAAGMYSSLAGFIEPGETIEDAVRREVFEEAHVKCARVAYFASQPWPFPSSLMIGCFARATDSDIVVDKNELEDARWFSRAEVASMLAGTHPDGLSAPKPYAIAHHLLKAYVAHGPSLADG